jgi:molecular chaperone HtpG
LTDSAVCIVASELGPDRQLEKMLMGAGRIDTAAKPVLEINPHHDLIRSLAALDSGREPLKQDAAHLLLDEALILDGERPADPKDFSDRLARILRQSIG